MVLDNEELEHSGLLDAAAEALDDAHEEWLEGQIKSLEAHLECLILAN